MNKKQLHCSLHSTTKKLICAKKKATTTAKKLSAAKAQCTIIAKIAQDRCKESDLAHQKAEIEVNAIRDEMKIERMMLRYCSPICCGRTGHHASGPALFMVYY
jgi:hypothetical protein